MSWGALARLRMLQARGRLRWLLWAFGIDLGRDRGFLERTYQLYIALVVAGVLALAGAQALSYTARFAAYAGPAARAMAGAASVGLPALALAVLAVGSLRETPVRLIRPDVSYLARVALPVQLLAVAALPQAFVVAAAGVCGGVLLGTLAGEPPAAALAWSGPFSARLAAAWAASLAAGTARAAAPRRLRTPLTVAVGACALLLAGLLAMAPWPVAAAAAALLLPASAALASCADMAFVVEDNYRYAALYELRFMAVANAGAYREECRRVRRRPGRARRRTWRFASGRAACVSRALLALARRPSALLGVMGLGGALLPVGALLIAARVQPMLLVGWLLCLGESLRNDPPELGRVFRADAGNRLARSLLPFGTLELVLLDAVPALALSSLASVCVVAAACAAASAAGAPIGPLVPLATVLLMNLLVALSSGLDDPARRGRRATGMSFTVLALLVAGALSLADVALAPAALLVACAGLALSLRGERP